MSTKSIQRRAIIEQRRVMVASLMVVGLSVREMVTELAKQGIEVSTTTVQDDKRRIQKAWRESYTADFAAHASSHLATLDAVQRVLMPKALLGHLPVVDRLLAVMDRRAKLLGLDAPSKVEVSLKVELVAQALEATLIELGVSPADARPVLGRNLRELEAATTP